MKISDDELLEIIEDVTVTLGQILLRHRELTEGLLGHHQIERSLQKIDDLKLRIDSEKQRLRQTRQAQQRKRDLEKLRGKTLKKSTTENVTKNRLRCLRDERGRVLGWVRSLAKDRIDFLDGRGRLVGRYFQGKTYDKTGRFVGDGDQGLRVLGQSLGCR